jgi:hypothetical protein
MSSHVLIEQLRRSCHQISHRCYRQEQTKRVRRQGLEAMAFIQGLTPRNLDQVSIVQNIEHHYSNAECIGCEHYPLESINEKIATVAPACETLIYADHGYVGSRYVAVAWLCASELRRQVCVTNGMGIQSIEADDHTIRSNHHENAQVVSFGKLVGRALEEVVDLLDATGEVLPVMAFWVKRFDGRLCRVH